MKKIFLGLITLMFLGSGLAYAGTYRDSAHGNSVDGAAIGYGVYRSSTSQYEEGHCAHCHEQHASIGGSEPDPDSGGTGSYSDEYHHLLFRKSYTSQTDTICYDCHGTGTAYTSGITNYSYSKNFGGNNANYDSNIKDAFGHTIAGSSHYLPNIVTQILDVTTLKTAGNQAWQLKSNSDPSLNPRNPCDACHNPHLAKRSCNLPGSYDPTKSAISRPSNHNNLWGDDDTERMDDYPGTYQAPYWYNSTNYEPYSTNTIQTGSNLPDYVTFCTDCHNTYNTINTTNPRYPGTSPLTKIDWSSSTGDVHGQRNSTAKKLRPPYSSTNKVLSCLDCHEPHGSMTNIFLLRTEINGVAGVSVPDTSDASWQNLCFGKCHNSRHTHKNNCSTCHKHNGTF
ncbi:MAG: hypothetical protein KAU60_16985 [Desulfobacterales bacterium]|nr:hypothetical protein [Desulfobacterales bacterium]